MTEGSTPSEDATSNVAVAFDATLMALTYSEPLPVGWNAVDFELQDTEKEVYSLSDFSDKKGLLIVFSCNHCPYARASWPVLISLYHRYKEEIGFIAVNPNDEAVYPDDSFEEMKKKKAEWDIPFAYLRDESQKMAKQYHAVCTPDPYVFRNEGKVFKLFYHGRINDNWQNPEHVTEKNLEDAIDLLLKGKSPPKNQHPSMGCSIKWKKIV